MFSKLKRKVGIAPHSLRAATLDELAELLPLANSTDRSISTSPNR